MNRSRTALSPGVSSSLLLHLLFVALWLAGGRVHPSAPRSLRLPGTVQGQHLMLTYSTGGPVPSQESSPLQHVAAAPKHPRAVANAVPAPAITPVAALAEAGSGLAGDSARGDENLRVALPQVHPRPQPDLSGLPRGTAGDVVVDVVIDDTGKVTAATLVKGLGSSIDSAVVRSLRDWTFTPANRNGQNVASEQQILIHYERG